MERSCISWLTTIITIATIFTVTSGCFISNCPEKGQNLYPWIPGQIETRKSRTDGISNEQKNPRIILDFSYFTGVDSKKSKRDLRFLYNFLYKDKKPRGRKLFMVNKTGLS